MYRKFSSRLHKPSRHSFRNLTKHFSRNFTKIFLEILALIASVIQTSSNDNLGNFIRNWSRKYSDIHPGILLKIYPGTPSEMFQGIFGFVRFFFKFLQKISQEFNHSIFQKSFSLGVDLEMHPVISSKNPLRILAEIFQRIISENLAWSAFEKIQREIP